MEKFIFKDGEICKCVSIYQASDDLIREALSWNDPGGDFDNLPRAALLEIFLSDFIVTKDCQL